MDNTVQDSVMKQSFINSIGREELLLKKYDGYEQFIEDTDMREMLKDFRETARDHMDMLKDKLQKLKL